MRAKLVVAPIASAMLIASAVSSVSAVQGKFVYQQSQRVPFEQAHTYLLRGVKTNEGCSYTYPPFRPPADVTLWESRDVGVDDASCLKIVEEGIPASVAFDTSAQAARADAVGPPSLGSLAGTTASGYAHAWYENLFGQSLTSDTTYLTWSYSGGCVTGSSTYGEWTWNTGYGWSLTSNNGSRTQTCAKVTGRTWSTYTLGGGSCHHYYTAVDAVGDASGGFTGSRSDSANCGPVWEHFQYLKTT